MIGAKIILQAVEEPIRQMSKNAGLSPDLIIDKVFNCEIGEGYDFIKNEIIELSNSGIIDPVKVTRCALENANSVASTLITSGHAIVS